MEHERDRQQSVHNEICFGPPSASSRAETSLFVLFPPISNEDVISNGSPSIEFAIGGVRPHQAAWSSKSRSSLGGGRAAAKTRCSSLVAGHAGRSRCSRGRLGREHFIPIVSEAGS